MINKADRDGADKLVSELQQMMALGGDDRERTPILKTVATRGEGIGPLTLGIEQHLARPESADARRRRRLLRARVRLTDILGRTLFERVVAQGIGLSRWDRIVERLAARETDPYTAVEDILSAGERT